MEGRKVKKKFVALLLVFVQVVSMVAMSATFAFAEDDGVSGVASDGTAMGRLSAFISLAAGKQETDKKINLTKDQLRFLGVFISNYYVPFVTEFGVASGKESEDTFSDIQAALSNNMDFSEDVAKGLSENLFGLMRSNNKKLTMYISDKRGKKGTKVKGVKVNGHSFTSVMLGEMPEKNKGRYVNFVQDGNIVFDACVSSGNDAEVTPAQAAFLQCMGITGYSNGYVTNFYDASASDKGLEEKLKKVDKAQLKKFTELGTEVCISCFGDIIFKGNNHQYVAVPACMNPFVWQPVDSSGDDVGKAGDNFNVVNFHALSLAEQGKLVAGNLSSGGVAATSGSVKNPKVTFTKGSAVTKAYKKNGKKVLNHLNSVARSLGGGVTFRESKTGSKNVVADITNPEKVRGYKTKNIRTTSKYGLSKEDQIEAFKSIISEAKSSKSSNKKKNIVSYTGKASIGSICSNIIRGSHSESNLRMYVRRGDNDQNFDTAIFGGLWGVTQPTIKAYNKSSNLKVKGDLGATIEANYLWYVPKFTTSDSSSSNNIPYMSKTVFVDDLGAYAESTADNFSALPMKDVIDSSGSSVLQETTGDIHGGFGSLLKDMNDSKIRVLDGVKKEITISVYFSYAVASFSDGSNKADGIGKLGYRLNADALPKIENAPLNIGMDGSDTMLDSIKGWLYYLLHPTKGLNYVKVLITNKLNALLVGWHEEMIGSDGVGQTVGTTTYRQSSGYTSLPSLDDTEIGQKILGIWNSASIYLVIGVIIILFLCWVIGVMTPQKAAVSCVIACILLMLPGLVLGNATNLTNNISDKIYGNKFTYWAMVQSESYTDKIDEAASGDSYENYLTTLYGTNSEAKANQGGQSIVVKWQAPKKMASLMLTKKDEEILGGMNQMISGLINKTYSGESYVDKKNYNYLNRSYLDIQNFSRYIYRATSNGDKPVYKSINNSMMSNWDNSLKESFKSFNTKYSFDREKGYCNPNKDGTTSSKDIQRMILPLTSGVINDAYGQEDTIKDLKRGQYVGVSSEAFNFSLPMYNIADMKFKDQLGGDNFNASKYTEEDLAALGVYGIFSENVYYYYSWMFYESGLEPESSSVGGFKDLLLSQEDAGYFYNKLGNGELKDFVDMRSLFTYVIPYLRKGNDIVREWDNLYGVFIYDGVPTEEGLEDDPEIKNNKELSRKYWHNVNVARLYNIYTPWVDVMYDCSYAQPERVTALGKKVTVDDPIDPASYPKERPMIFSKSEMVDYGLKKGDLTRVERRIIEAQEGMQEGLFDLLNYHNFNDVTLNSAAAMTCAFEFNKVFSEPSLFGQNKQILPQSFSLADFSYDAYLRFTLANSTGERLDQEGDFYETVVKKSSTTTALLLIVNDILALYAIPSTKYMVVIGLFILCALLIASTAFRMRTNSEARTKIKESVLIPMLKYLGYGLGFSILTLVMMGKGNDMVTRTGSETVELGSPSATLLALILVHTLFVILMVKLVIHIVKNIKMEGALVGGFMGNILVDAFRKSTNGLKKAIGKNQSSKASAGESAGGVASKGKANGGANERAYQRSNGHAATEKVYVREDEEKHKEDKNKESKRSYWENKDKKGANKSTSERKSDIDKKAKEGINKLNNSMRRSRENTNKNMGKPEQKK